MSGETIISAAEYLSGDQAVHGLEASPGVNRELRASGGEVFETVSGFPEAESRGWRGEKILLDSRNRDCSRCFHEAGIRERL